jgi:hypothetical protein
MTIKRVSAGTNAGTGIAENQTKPVSQLSREESKQSIGESPLSELVGLISSPDNTSRDPAPLNSVEGRLHQSC